MAQLHKWCKVFAEIDLAALENKNGWTIPHVFHLFLTWSQVAAQLWWVCISPIFLFEMLQSKLPVQWTQEAPYFCVWPFLQVIVPMLKVQWRRGQPAFSSAVFGFLEEKGKMREILGLFVFLPPQILGPKMSLDVFLMFSFKTLSPLFRHRFFFCLSSSPIRF